MPNPSRVTTFICMSFTWLTIFGDQCAENVSNAAARSTTRDAGAATPGTTDNSRTWRCHACALYLRNDAKRLEALHSGSMVVTAQQELRCTRFANYGTLYFHFT